LKNDVQLKGTKRLRTKILKKIQIAKAKEEIP